MVATEAAAGAAPRPLVIPVALGLVAREGGPVAAVSERVHDGVFVLETAEDILVFDDVAAPPSAVAVSRLLGPGEGRARAHPGRAPDPARP